MFFSCSLDPTVASDSLLSCDLQNLVEDKMKANDEELTEMEKEYERIAKILEIKEDLDAEIAEKKKQIKLNKNLASQTREMLQEDLTEKGTGELKKMLSSFDSEIKEQNEQKDEFQRDVAKLSEDITNVTKEESKLQSDIGRYRAEKEAQEQRQTQRWEKLSACDEKFHLKSVLTGESLTQQSQSQNTSYHASSLGDLSMSGGSQRHGDQTPQLEISKTDMKEFLRLLRKKKHGVDDDLSEKLREKQRMEDEITNQISEFKASLKSIEKERGKLRQGNQDAQNELSDINKRIQGMPRMRKEDIEEAKRNAAKFAADRDKANNDTRRQEIPVEIRSLEEKVDRTFQSHACGFVMLFPFLA